MSHFKTVFEALVTKANTNSSKVKAIVHYGSDKSNIHVQIGRYYDRANGASRYMVALNTSEFQFILEKLPLVYNEAIRNPSCVSVELLKEGNRTTLVKIERIKGTAKLHFQQTVEQPNGQDSKQRNVQFAMNEYPAILKGLKRTAPLVTKDEARDDLTFGKRLVSLVLFLMLKHYEMIVEKTGEPCTKKRKLTVPTGLIKSEIDSKLPELSSAIFRIIDAFRINEDFLAELSSDTYIKDQLFEMEGKDTFDLCKRGSDPEYLIYQTVKDLLLFYEHTILQ